jgi:hypothetical protein
VITFNKMDEHRFGSAGQWSEAVLHVDQQLIGIGAPQGSCSRSGARGGGWAT